MSEARIPVLVGSGQLVEREEDPVAALEPLAMLERVARTSAQDAGASEQALAELDLVALVDLCVGRVAGGAPLPGAPAKGRAGGP